MKSRTNKIILLAILISLTLAVSEILPCKFGNYVWAEDKPNLMQQNLKTLREAAAKFAKAYAKRDFKTMYSLVNPQFRKLVPLWEYKDFVDYPGVTDGFISVDVAEVNVLPNSNYKYGKVMQKIVITENQKIKTTGETVKVSTEKWEFQDWVIINGQWYKVEKIESN